MSIVLSLLLTAAVAAVIWLARLHLQDSKSLARFSLITDLEAHRDALSREAAALEQRNQAVRNGLAGLESEYASRRHAAQTQLERDSAELMTRVANLRVELEQVEEGLELQSFGVYRTQYGFEHVEQYKQRLTEVRAAQKESIKAGQAARCEADWTVGGSAAQGQKMVNEQIKLMLRAFNGECDAAIAKVKYNNVTKLAARIEKAFAALNKLGKTKQISLQYGYLQLKLAELQLVHEHREAVQRDKEEQAEIKHQMREEARARKELEKAQADAEQDEAAQEAALLQARAELARATGDQLAKLGELVSKLETELHVAIDRKAKAIARAQLTRSGHVYVLSNIGSFGENCYKIGMTRRLEPLDRVKELGDASVPFTFDVHAMIYAEDAPGLESALHREFTDGRVNMVNTRKEFFRVTLDQLRHAVAKHHGIVTFVMQPEAEEFRKSNALLQEQRAELAAAAESRAS